MLVGTARKVLIADIMLAVYINSVAVHTAFGEQSMFEQDVGAEAGHD